MPFREKGSDCSEEAVKGLLMANKGGKPPWECTYCQQSFHACEPALDMRARSVKRLRSRAREGDERMS